MRTVTIRTCRWRSYSSRAEERPRSLECGRSVLYSPSSVPDQDAEIEGEMRLVPAKVAEAVPTEEQ